MDVFEAVIRGNEEEVSRLLDADPSLIESQDNGRTRLLARAAQYGHIEVVKLLVQRGAEINTPAVEELSALDWASLHGYEEIVAWLLSKGAQVDRMGVFGNTPLMWACSRGNRFVVRRLLQYLGEQGLNRRNRDGWTALHVSSRTDGELVRLLLLAGADPSMTNNEGRTPRARAQLLRHGGCVAVFEWWEGELERRYFLHRARRLHDASTTHQATPTTPLPAFLHDRTAAGQALLQVEVVSTQQEQQQAGASGKRRATREAGSTDKEEEKHAVLAYVVRQLNEQLFTELLQGFHA